MICNLFLRMRTHSEHAIDPVCGVVVLSEPLLAVLEKLDVAAWSVRQMGGFSASFLCGFSVYGVGAIPDDPTWHRIIARLHDGEEALVVRTAEPISWDEQDNDVYLAISYGKGNVVFQCQDEYSAGSTESDFVALSDIKRWSLRGS